MPRPVQCRPRGGGFQDALYEMEVALVCLQLRRRHILNGDRVVGGVGNDSVAMGVVIRCRKKPVDICKDGFAEPNGVGFGRKVSNGDLTKIGRDDECILTRSGAVITGDLDWCSIPPPTRGGWPDAT